MAVYEGLGERERLVLEYLASRDPREPSPTNRQIASAVGRSRWEVGRAIQVLKALGQISVTIEEHHLRTITVL